MTGPDNFIATETLRSMMILKAQIARLEGENEELRERDATLRTTAQSLCKWYEGQKGLRGPLENMAKAFISRHGCYPNDRTTPEQILWNDAMAETRAALKNHKGAEPLWRPLLDCMEKKS